MTSDVIDLPALRDRAAQSLAVFVDPARAAERAEMTALLRPQDADYERVFIDKVVPLARAAYGTLWTSVPPISGRAGHAVVFAWVCMSEQFGTPAASRFPGGYARIAPALRPGVPWFCWKFVAPGRTLGVSYDGLVRLDDRWLWFPKPWKVLRAAVSPLSHWSE